MTHPLRSPEDDGRYAAHHWLQFLGDSDARGRDVDFPLSAPGSLNVAAAADYAEDRMVLFRFDDDLAPQRADLGHRILFSAREEDEHPDLVGTEDFS